MAEFKAGKLIASLPAQLSANQVYFVRRGIGFDVFCTDSSGQVAHRLNPAKRFVQLQQDYSTTKITPQQTGLKLAVEANKKYLVRVNGAVKTSSIFGAVGLGIKLPSGTVCGSVSIENTDNSVRTFGQLGIEEIRGTTSLRDNNQNNVFTGEYLIGIGATAGDIELIMQSNSTWYTATVSAGAVIIIEELIS